MEKNNEDEDEDEVEEDFIALEDLPPGFNYELTKEQIEYINRATYV